MFVLRMMWSESDMISEMRSPRRSDKGECQDCEWALMSPDMIELGRVVMKDMQLWR